MHMLGFALASEPFGEGGERATAAPLDLTWGVPLP
jgi:hypothetical protein